MRNREQYKAVTWQAFSLANRLCTMQGWRDKEKGLPFSKEYERWGRLQQLAYETGRAAYVWETALNVRLSWVTDMKREMTESLEISV